ncbi:MAG: T9SS type A sorting domain-containing protein [Bacteroidetes bacterium]|nr:T9SS type A sorting domain-containing protein [Bacteroidota bacterium]
MKKILSLAASAVLATSVVAQSSFERLDINHFNAGFNAAGDQLSLIPNFTNNVITPYNQVPFSIGNLWIGGYDQGGQLHVAAQTYRQNGTDFWAGAMDTSLAVSSGFQTNFYNKVWKINKTTVDSFRLGLFTVVPASITTWPGNGSVANNEGHLLAPYVDVNGDGMYNYLDGDYPKIRGDQSLFFVYNDSLDTQDHGETGGRRMGVEIRCLAYAVNCNDSALANTIFLHFDIINRSSTTYDSTVAGLWTDLDVGTSFNNNVGSDSLQNDFYYYSNYFAVGAIFLNRTMTSTMNYNNDFSVTGNPVGSANYYGYMRGRWKDGTSLTYGGNGYGGTSNTSYCYTGNPFSGTGWNSGTPVDRRMLGSIAPFTLQPGEIYSVDMAYVACYDPTSTLNLCVPNLKQRMQSIRNYYTNDLTPCGDNITSVPDAAVNSFTNIFPNPVSSSFTLHTSSLQTQPYFIFDLTGRQLTGGTTSGNETHIDVEGLPAGIYFLRTGEGAHASAMKFVKTE